MEEIARKVYKKILWNGKNVTEDISKYISEITYTDHEEEALDDISIKLDNTLGNWSNQWQPLEGDTLEVFIGYEDKSFKCGLFQVDEVVDSWSPDITEVKALSSFITKKLRTKNSHAFEAQTLRQIAQYFCKKHNLGLVDDTSNMLSQINLERKTQEEKTDLAFLSELAKEYGFIFNIKGDKLVFTSYYNLDNAPSVKSIYKWQTTSGSITRKTYDTYSSAKLSERDVKSNEVKNDNQKWDSTTVSDNDLVVKGKGGSAQGRHQKVKGGLWNKNKFQTAGSLELVGTPEFLSGVNFDFIGMYLNSGKYHITSSTHRLIGNEAYLTSIEIRRTGTVPKPRRVPPVKEDSTIGGDEDYDGVENESFLGGN